MAHAAADCLQRYRPDYCFVYLEGVDQAGHKYGWMSKDYLEALHTTDTAVGILLHALHGVGLGKETNIILHSDHGGNGHHHKEADQESLTIPGIAWGPDICNGLTIGCPVTILDTAPTIATLLKIPSHYSWEGKPVAEIFKSSQKCEAA